MKNRNKLKAMRSMAGIIALVAIIGFSMATLASCDDGSNPGGSGGGGGLSGTYYYGSSYYITFYSNGSFTTHRSYTYGYYTLSGNTITLSEPFYGRTWTRINSNRLRDGQGDYWNRR